MSLLLDTHVVLWWFTDDTNLSEEMKARLEGDPDVWVSVATVWEVAIKQSIGKITEPPNLSETVAHSGFRQLPISFEHAVAAGKLPPVHRDPFDRMLVAQARSEGLTLVTRDPQIQRYDVALLPV